MSAGEVFKPKEADGLVLAALGALEGRSSFQRFKPLGRSGGERCTALEAAAVNPAQLQQPTVLTSYAFNIQKVETTCIRH